MKQEDLPLEIEGVLVHRFPILLGRGKHYNHLFFMLIVLFWFLIENRRFLIVVERIFGQNLKVFRHFKTPKNALWQPCFALPTHTMMLYQAGTSAP